MSTKIQYSLNEVCLLPSAIPSDISSRQMVDPFVSGRLPVFVAPMSSVIDEDNAGLFKQNGFTPIIPRSVDIEKRLKLCFDYWTAFSLREFDAEFAFNGSTKITDDQTAYVLIDVANGHMKDILDLVKQAKRYYGSKLKIMAGNIAHPNMYKYYCEAGIDACRLGIAGGSACSTCQTGIHSSHLWMIEEIKKMDCYKDPNRTKLIADGGINTIDKAIKALAIGYDYVMMGKIFAQCSEACGETRYRPYQAIGWAQDYDGVWEYSEDTQYITERKYYGMASTDGQVALGCDTRKNPEGITTWIPVNTDLRDVRFKFESALRSAMSYTGSHDLNEFRNSEYGIQSIEEFKSYYK